MPVITEEIQQELAAHGITPEEYERILGLLGRAPNRVELGMFSVLWSEHCSYKSSRAFLKLFPTTSPRVLQGPGENAGVVRISDTLAIAMKIESHNHPSAIEPYQGAATGVGGIVRDIFTMGARPIASLNSLRFGPLTDPHNRHLFANVVAGIGGYGNCLGLPTVAGEVYFDESYSGNPLVNAMCVGLVRLSPDSVDGFLPRVGPGLIRARADGPGNIVVYIGSATGRDGIHGATFASEDLGEDSEERRPAVQIGDPFTEKLLIEACLELIQENALIGMQDMGAAGLTSSSCEMAARSGTGLQIDLDKVPLREPNITPYEILLSESQERMLAVVAPERLSDVVRIVEKWGLHAVAIGSVTEDRHVRITSQGEVCADVPAKALVDDAPTYYRRSAVPDYFQTVQNLEIEQVWLEKILWNDELLAILSSPSVASKRWVYEQYDHMVQVGTLLYPGVGDAAVLKLPEGDQSIALTTDGNSRYCYLDPFAGGRIAVAEAVRNLAAVGAEGIALTNCLNFGNPEKPESFWQFEQVVKGMIDACKAFGIPVVSGNVSFYNEGKSGAIYPTPVIGMLGILPAPAAGESPVGIGFQKAGDLIVLVGETLPELGGSEWLKVILGKSAGKVPDLNLALEKSVHGATIEAIRSGVVHSAHDLSEGGLAVALTESILFGALGAQGAAVSIMSELASLHLLFSESQSRMLISLGAEDVFVFEEIARKHGAPFEIIGKVNDKDMVVKKGTKKILGLTFAEMAAPYFETIPRMMGEKKRTEP